MVEDNENDLPVGDEGQEYIPAVYARNEEDAEKYCALLEDHDIPVMVGHLAQETPGRGASSMSRSVPILVPEEFLDEASEIIADSEDTQDFLDEEELEDEEEEDEEFDFADNIDDEDDLGQDEEEETFLEFDDEDDPGFDDLDEDDFDEDESL